MNRKKACFYVDSETQGTKNYPFLGGAEGEGFKNLYFPYVELQQTLAKSGVDLSTRDINSPEDSALLICLDNPHKVKSKKQPGQIWCLIINDPPVYCPESWDKRWHDRFDFVFTYDETLVDGDKYRYVPIPQDTEFFSIPPIVTKAEFEQRLLATNVSNAIHKYMDAEHPNCMHFRRYATIKWYGKNHPQDFRFFGGTFLKRNYYFAFRGVRLFERVIPKRLFENTARWAQRDLIKVFGGELKPLEKFEVIRNFNFYYCYENTVGINGYLTEKMFDCLYSGVVPIYWGAPNVRELVPYDCYIEGDNFDDEEGLFDFISTMSYETYRSYLEQASVFLRSPEIQRLTVENFIRCLLSPLKHEVSDYFDLKV